MRFISPAQDQTSESLSGTSHQIFEEAVMLTLFLLIVVYLYLTIDGLVKNN